MKRNKLKTLVKTFSKDVPLYNNFKKPIELNTNSFFDIIETKSKKINKKNYNFNNKVNNDNDASEKLYAKKIQLIPTDEQKKILLKMLEGCRLMYNKTNKIIKQHVHEKKHIPTWRTIRTNFMKDYKKKITQEYNVLSHTLDHSIHECSSHYKSCKNNKNVKHFNIRYKKFNKNHLNMTIEKTALKDKGFMPSKISDEIKNTSNSSYKSEHDVILTYDRRKDIFTFIKPKKYTTNNERNTKKKYISIDPGIRKYMTCMDDEGIIEIGKNLKQHFEKNFKKLDLYDSKKSKCKKKREQLYQKMRNKIDDLHWKTANYLTNNYENILIGNMSTQSVISNEDTKLDKLNKRTLLLLRLYNFRERLEYKCKLKDVNYMLIDESYTSKTCSNCGNLKKNLGGNKTYKCDECNICIDRDYNGCRNIFYHGLKK